MTSFARRLLPLSLPLLACGAPAGDGPVGSSTQASTVCASGTVVQGVDVSTYQGSVDWTTVKGAGIDFAIARISDGSSLDSYFASNWAGMKSAGLVRGAYQYFEPGEDPTTQANIVVSAVGELGAGDLPVTADMETTGGESAGAIAANLQTWMSAVKAGTGKVPMIYTAEGYWNADVDSSAFASNPLWVANWGPTCPDLPTTWSAWSLWQYSDSGSVSGISGAVDLDEFNGTLADLKVFAGSADYAAEYVTQSWPLASSTMTMKACDTIAASITLKNIGTKSWDSKTRLGTTQPRDRESLFADSSWLSPDRPAGVTGTVAPGDTFEFKFDFHAPPTTGAFTEYFGVVEDGVAWFSDSGQGGPPDSDIEANISVTAGSTSCTADPGFDDAGAKITDAGGATRDSSTREPVPDGAASTPPGDASGGAGKRDSGVPSSTIDAAAEGDGGAGEGSSGGCTLTTTRPRATWPAALLAGLCAVGAASRRRRTR